jgi:hypothetical protein
MIKFPIEIVRIGNEFSKEIEESVELLNNMQKEFDIQIADSRIEEQFQLLNFREVYDDEILTKVEAIKGELKGYHPNIIAITSSQIKITGTDNSSLYANTFTELGTSFLPLVTFQILLFPKKK